MPIGAWLLPAPFKLLAATWRLRVVAGEKTLERLAERAEPAVYAYWHQSLYPCTIHIYRFARRRRVPLATLISLSRDGELVARMAPAFRVEAIRGSTSRAGLSGLRALRRAIVRRGRSILATPDGPRGPARRFQAGTIALAATSGAPIVPLACAADRSWRLRSWDRLVVPKPFARVVVRIGEPMVMEKAAEPAEGAERVERTLDELTRLCEEAVARPDSAQARSRGRSR